MKKIFLSLAVICSTLTYAGGNYAQTETQSAVLSTQSQFYGGIGLAAIATYGNSLDWFTEKDGQDKTGAIVGILGYQFTQNIAVEGRLSIGAISTDYSQSTNFSLFVKPSYNITPKIAVYGLLGFGWVKIDGHNGYGDIVNKVSPQIGLGTNYKINDNVDLFADYTWLLHNKKTKVTLPDGSNKVSHEAFTLGLNYHF